MDGHELGGGFKKSFEGNWRGSSAETGSGLKVLFPSVRFFLITKAGVLSDLFCFVFGFLFGFFTSLAHFPMDERMNGWNDGWNGWME